MSERRMSHEQLIHRKYLNRRSSDCLGMVPDRRKQRGAECNQDFAFSTDDADSPSYSGSIIRDNDSEQ